jgi:outer membrane immunogenic protein
MRLLASLGLAALVAASPAIAADMEVPAVYKMAPPAYSWTGCYVGALAGGIADATNFGTFSWGSGFVGGGQIGCNYQIDRFVFGVEGDFLGSTLQVQNGGGSGLGGTTSKVQNPWDGDIAVRGGLVVYDRVLIFNKVGVAFGRYNYTTNTTFGVPLVSTTTTGSTTLPGFMDGFGVEFMITPHWSAKFEADVVLYSSSSVNFTCTPTATCGGPLLASTTASQNEFQARGLVGLNYKFW